MAAHNYSKGTDSSCTRIKATVLGFCRSCRQCHWNMRVYRRARKTLLTHNISFAANSPSRNDNYEIRWFGNLSRYIGHWRLHLQPIYSAQRAATTRPTTLVSDLSLLALSLVHFDFAYLEAAARLFIYGYAVLWFSLATNHIADDAYVYMRCKISNGGKL